MRLLLLGKNGQLGFELQRTLATVGEVIAVRRGAHGDDMSVDFADVDALRAIVRRVRPDIIVNAAAYTAVDQAELEPAQALAVNGTAPGVLAEEALRLGAGLIHYSTDYVFDGGKSCAYSEDDAPQPLNTYGKTKLAGEKALREVGGAHLILRTSWVYGDYGKNFLLTILKLARERGELAVVNDQIGAPTWSRVIAQCTAQMIAMINANAKSGSMQERFALYGGLYHLSCSGQTSWYGFAERILALAVPEMACLLRPIISADYGARAIRPRNSRLDCALICRTFPLFLPSWEDALRLCLRERRANRLERLD